MEAADPETEATAIDTRGPLVAPTSDAVVGEAGGAPLFGDEDLGLSITADDRLLLRVSPREGYLLQLA